MVFAHKELQPEDLGTEEGLRGVGASKEAAPREPERMVIKGLTTWSTSWPRHLLAL